MTDKELGCICGTLVYSHDPVREAPPICPVPGHVAKVCLQCGNPPRYHGARYCGWKCSARTKGGEPPLKARQAATQLLGAKVCGILDWPEGEPSFGKVVRLVAELLVALEHQRERADLMHRAITACDTDGQKEQEHD